MKNRIKYLIILFVICCGHLANATGIWVEAESFLSKAVGVLTNNLSLRWGRHI